MPWRCLICESGWEPGDWVDWQAHWRWHHINEQKEE